MFQHIKTWATAIAAILWLIVLTQVSNAQITSSPTYSIKRGLPSSTINQITEDENNKIWIATENGIKIINNPNSQWLEKRILGKSVIQIGFLDPYVFIGCRDSLLIVDQTTKKTIQQYSKQAIGSIIKIRKLQNTLWIVTQNSVLKWLKNKFVKV